MRAIRMLCTVALCQFLVISYSRAQNNADIQIAVRLAPSGYDANTNLPKFDDDLLLELTLLSKPEVITINAGEDLISVLEKKYGLTLGSAWPLLKKLNKNQTIFEGNDGPPNTLISSAPISISLPVAPKVYQSDVPVLKGSSISNLAFENMGTSNPVILSQLCNRYFEIKEGEEIVNCQLIYEGTSVNMPVIEPAYFTLKEKELSDYQSLMSDRLRENSSVYKIEEWEIRDREGLATYDQCQTEDGNEQFDTNVIDRALKINARLSKRYEDQRVKIIVADTGISKSEFDLGRFKFGSGAITYATNVHYGIDLSDSIADGFPLAMGFEHSDVLNHGTHVSGILFNSLATSGVLSERIRKYFRLIVVKVNSGSDNLIKDDALQRAISYSQLNNAHIVNMSIESRRYLGLFSELKKSGGPLYIFSSGNKNIKEFVGEPDVKDNGLWPMMYGGDTLTNVIVVGAYDSDNKKLPAEYSNTSKRYVDLGAPGTCVSSLSVKSTERKIMSGTSQAAPLVSMTAGILMSYDISDGDKKSWVKYRLISAVDFFPSLLSHYYSSGNLNIEKSIRIFEDLLEVDGKIIAGVILSPNFQYEGAITESISLKNLMKLKPYINRSRNFVRLVTVNFGSKGLKTYRVEDRPNYFSGDVRFLTSEGKVISLGIGKIDDLVLTKVAHRKDLLKDICFQHNLEIPECNMSLSASVADNL